MIAELFIFLKLIDLAYMIIEFSDFDRGELIFFFSQKEETRHI